jgi:PAS domain-containing protein
LKRQPGLADSPLDAALEEAVSLCTALLQELSGAEMEIQRCAADARAERQQADDLFDHMLMPCVCADDNGRITRANRAAALFLHVSVRRLVGQPLLHFTLDRERFLDLIRRMCRDRTLVQSELMIRPRERSTIHAAVTVIPRSAGTTTEWLWFFAPEPIARADSAPARSLIAASTATIPSDDRSASVTSS